MDFAYLYSDYIFNELGRPEKILVIDLQMFFKNLDLLIVALKKLSVQTLEMRVLSWLEDEGWKVPRTSRW